MRGKNTKRTRRAQALRKVDNDCEKYFWSIVRNRQLNGFKFNRQFPIGPYFADFVCRSEKLVVELDGSQHADSQYDRRRDQFMVTQGWSVLRFWNSDIFTDQAAVEETVVAVLERRMIETAYCGEFSFVSASIK